MDLTPLLKASFDAGASAGGVLVIFLVIGLVGVAKEKLGVQGKALTWLSLGLGIFWGGCNMVARLPLPAASFLPIFIYVMSILSFGFAYGIIACLFYDVFKGMLSKLIERAIATLLEAITTQASQVINVTIPEPAKVKDVAGIIEALRSQAN